MNEEAPKEEKGEVRGTVLTPDQVSDWGNETRLVEPGVKTEAGDEVKPEEKVEEKVEEVEAKEEVVLPEVEEPVSSLQDPGEYKPIDLSFEVVTYDEEGKHPKVVKIKDVEQWDELVNGDPNFGSAGALLKAQRLATKMETGLEKDYSDWKEAKDKYGEQVQSETTKTEALNTMVNEVGYLIERGDLPKVANQYVNADWNDPEIAKQSGVKEQIELVNYMQTENKRRVKAGLAPMTSMIDGFNAMQLDKNKKDNKENKDKVARERQEAGSKIAGSTPNPVTTAPKGIAVGRGGNLRDLNNSNWS